MRSVRTRRRSFIDFRRILIGDYIVLVASFMTLVSLFMPWFVSSIGPARSQPAFAYSAVAATVVIIFFLLTLFLVLYPAMSHELGLPPLPFSPPVIFLAVGSVLVLLFTYELGKYACVQCSGSGRGYGVWLAWVASGVYIVGAVVLWGSRPLRRV
ncbi:MAG: hypothetical protein NVS2B16_06670 [Chloroflexota bacterium]